MPRNFQPSDTASHRTRRRCKILNYIDVVLDENTACSLAEPKKLRRLLGTKIYHHGEHEGVKFNVGCGEMTEEEGKGKSYERSNYMAYAVKPKAEYWKALRVAAFFFWGAEGEDGIWKDMIRALKGELSKFHGSGVLIEEASGEGESEEGVSGEEVSGGASGEGASGDESLERKCQVIMSRIKGNTVDG